MKKTLITSSLLLLFLGQSLAQQITELPAKIDQAKTGNTKDILTSFIQSGIDNLLGDKRSFKLNMSFLAIDSILSRTRATSKLDRKSFFRNSSLNLNLAGDSANNIVKWSAGLTLELVNKKDIRANVANQSAWKELVHVVDKYHDARVMTELYVKRALKSKSSYLSAEEIEILANEAERVAIISFQTAIDKRDFSLLSPELKATLSDPTFLATVKAKNDPGLDSAVADMSAGIHRPTMLLKKIADDFSRKPLWILKPTVSYDRIYKQGEYLLESDFTKGFGSLSKTPWELEFKGKLLIGADSTILTPNYKNKPLTFSAGINKVLLQNENNESRAELKFFTQYSYKIGDYIGSRDEFSLNSTLRFNVHKAIWLPITLKYDPENGNVFGFFSITANIGN